MAVRIRQDGLSRAVESITTEGYGMNTLVSHEPSCHVKCVIHYTPD